MMWNDWWWDWMWPWDTTTTPHYTWSTTSDPEHNKVCATNKLSSDDDIETENNITEETSSKETKGTSQADAMSEIFAAIDKFYKANGMTGDAVITTNGETKCFKLGGSEEEQAKINKVEQEKKEAYESLVQEDEDLREMEKEIRDKVRVYNKTIDRHNESARKYHYMHGSSYGPIFTKDHLSIR